MKLAKTWKVKVTGDQRSIQLYDAKGNEIHGDARWEGDFYCSHNQLTTLKGAPKVIGGDFNCDYNQLTTLKGAPKAVGRGFYCDNNQLTTLKGAPKEVGGNFDCFSNQLTSLKGAPKVIGGDFNCNYNQLTTLEGAPKAVGRGFYCAHNRLPANQIIPERSTPEDFLKLGYVYADGILQKLISTRTTKNLTIYKTQKLASKETFYVVFDGTNYSHGKTLKEAKTDLMYKISDRDTSKYRSWKKTDVKPVVELIQAYRVITGACHQGTKEFVSKIGKLPEKMKVEKVFKLTKGQYGAKEFKAFFN